MSCRDPKGENQTGPGGIHTGELNAESCWVERVNQSLIEIQPKDNPPEESPPIEIPTVAKRPSTSIVEPPPVYRPLVPLPPDRCGPDVTGWLVEEMVRVANLPRVTALATEVKILLGDLFVLNRAERLAAALLEFASLATDPDILDPKNKYGGAWVYPGDCPHGDCDYTLTICEKCYGADATGNLMYGFIGHSVVGFPTALLTVGGKIYAHLKGKSEGADDKAMIEAGADISSPPTKRKLCDSLAKKRAGKKAALKPNCWPCDIPWPPK